MTSKHSHQLCCISLTSLTQTKEIIAANLIDDTPTASKDIAA
ncbi:hypothetical protein ACL1KS_12070 [Corynebacterium striatum]